MDHFVTSDSDITPTSGTSVESAEGEATALNISHTTTDGDSAATGEHEEKTK